MLRIAKSTADPTVGTQAFASTGLTRRLLAVMAADVAGYSRLTEAAEDETHVRLRSVRFRIIHPTVVGHRGRIVKNTGDGFLAAFDSPIDALRCAIDLQREIVANEHSQPPDRRILFRIGINVADIITEPEDIYGSGVNIAARLEEWASPGGVVISAALAELIGPHPDVRLDNLGPLRLKNISRPVHAYSLRLPGAACGISTNARGRTSKRAKIPSIAVLPFRTWGGDAGDAYFGEGMVEDIIVALQAIRGLLVISRTSALSYRGGPFDLQKAGQDLGVRYLLSGSVRRGGERLRLVAKLSDVETGSVIWADRYEGALSELFDFQTRIASRIVWSVAPHVRDAELKRAMRKRPGSMNAYDLAMQAIDLMYRMNFADFERAGTLLESAISADDNYAAVHGYAALWHIHRIFQGWTNDPRADAAEAARLALAAVDRDPSDGFALSIYGHTRSVLFREYDAAVGIFDRALTAAPSNAMAWTLSSGVYAYMGEARTAITRAQQGLRLSPVDVQAHFYLTFLGMAHYVDGTYNEAVIWARKTASLNPRLCANLRVLIASLVALGRSDDARSVAAMLLSAQPRFCVSTYADVCPFQTDIRHLFLGRLRQAGLPE